MDRSVNSLVSKVVLSGVLPESDARDCLEKLRDCADAQFLNPVSEFISLRAKLIRSRNVSLLLEILEMVSKQSVNSNSDEVQEIADALKSNVRWHQGDKIFQRERPRCCSPVARSLQSIYQSYSLNTSGYVKESLLELSQLPKLDDTERTLLGAFLGLNPDAAVLGWKFWNLGELLQPISTLREVAAAKELVKGREADPRSVAFLCLSVGVFLQRFGNYSASRDWLKRGLVASDCSDGVWEARIYSALAQCEFHLGDVGRTRSHLELALKGRSKHFGPSGWQLRLCEVAFLLGKVRLGEDIVNEVLPWTIAHGEDLYYVWAVILKMKNNLGLDTAEMRRAYELAETRGMRRAVATFISCDRSISPDQ